MSQASAPAKLILCGEHAVVYGRPAIALPLADLRAQATVAPGPPGSGLRFAAPDLGRLWTAAEQPDDPLTGLALATLAHLGAPAADLTIAITSAIPIASGMGSGAAIGTAIVRALAAHLGSSLTPAEASALVYASEQRFHGTPSGIDNTVVAYEHAIWFQRPLADGRWWTAEGDSGDWASSASPSPIIEPIAVAAPFTLIIADTGVRSATHMPVGEVRRRWQAGPAAYEALFDDVGALVTRARVALAAGDLPALGALLDTNQALLERIGVSSPEIERLVAAARAAGALGAKLSGAGWGGVMLALVTPASRAGVAAALRAAGAARVLETTVAAG